MVSCALANIRPCYDTFYALLASVILEADCDCYTLQERLQTMTLTTSDMVVVAKYLTTLHQKTCVQSAKSSVKKLAAAKFQ